MRERHGKYKNTAISNQGTDFFSKTTCLLFSYRFCFIEIENGSYEETVRLLVSVIWSSCSNFGLFSSDVFPDDSAVTGGRCISVVSIVFSASQRRDHVISFVCRLFDIISCRAVSENDRL